MSKSILVVVLCGVNDMRNLIVVSTDIKELKGIGEEILLDKEGNVIAKFYNGNFVRKEKGNLDETLEVA